VASNQLCWCRSPHPFDPHACVHKQAHRHTHACTPLHTHAHTHTYTHRLSSISLSHHSFIHQRAAGLQITNVRPFTHTHFVLFLPVCSTCTSWTYGLRGLRWLDAFIPARIWELAGARSCHGCANWWVYVCGVFSVYFNIASYRYDRVCMCACSACSWPLVSISFTNTHTHTHTHIHTHYLYIHNSWQDLAQMPNSSTPATLQILAYGSTPDMGSSRYVSWLQRGFFSLNQISAWFVFLGSKVASSP